MFLLSSFLASDLSSWLRVAFIGWVVTTESFSSKVPPVTFKTIVVTFILGVADKETSILAVLRLVCPALR